MKHTKIIPTMKPLDEGKKEKTVAAPADGRQPHPRRRKAVLIFKDRTVFGTIFSLQIGIIGVIIVL